MQHALKILYLVYEMISNYNDFINGKTFSKKNILDLLKENKLNSEILNIKYLSFGKIFIKAKNNHKISLFKICLDKYSINLIHKFGGGKSGDLVYLIEKDHKKYVLKVFKKKKESKNEITIHTKMNNFKISHYFIGLY